MKKLFTLATLSAIALALPISSFAAAKKEAAPAGSAPADAAKKAAEKPADAAKAAKPIPMWSRVDTIDAAAKNFTHKNADGKVVTFAVTATTEINSGESA